MRQLETRTGAEKGAIVASKRKQVTSRKAFFLVCSIGAFVAFFAFAGGASAMRETAAAAPSIVSDQADYTPGSTVTLMGANWGAQEAVHVLVNDDAGQTWSYSADVTADGSGNFTHQFQLPNWFVADYSVTATGSSGATATTAFTDGNVSFALATADTLTPPSWTVNWTKYDDLTCTTVQTTGSVPGPGNVGIGNNKSVRPTSVTAASGYVFNYWSDTPSGTTPSSNTCTPDTATPRTLYAHFKAADATPPVITPVVTPSTPNGSNGWYKSGNITVSFTVTDPDSAVTSRSASCATDSTTTTVNTDGTTSITCTATSAGGTSSNTQTIKRDTTNPSVTLDALPASTTASTIDVSGTATDATSGVAGVTVNGVAASFTAPNFTRLAVPLSCGSNTISAVSSDNAGNSSTPANASVTRVCDTTAPTIAFSQTPDGSNGWFKTAPATVHVTATDSSGVASLDCKLDGTPVSLSNTGSTATTRSGDVSTSANGDHLVECQAVDSSSNSNTAAYADNQTHLKLDTTSPSITSSVSGTPGLNGWYVSNVDVSWTVMDAVSGIDAATKTGCNSITISSDTAGTTITCSVDDNAGNHTSNVVTIKRDATAPSVAVNPDRAADSMGWYNHQIDFTVVGSDDMSGIEGCDAGGSYNGPDTASGSVSRSCTDKAGNTGSGSFGFKFDKTAPGISFVGQSPAKNGNGWNKTDVTLSWTCTDSTSGPAASPVTQTITTEGAGQSATGTCNDKAGNSASSTNGDVNIDKTAPGISFVGQSPAKNGNGWNKTDVTLSWTCTDSLSGPEATPVTRTITTEGSGQTATGTCTDQAGNQASSTDGNVNLDKSAPTNITFSGIAAQTYPIADVPPSSGISCNANYDISGKDSCNVTGYGADFGSHTLTATATDLAGNQGTNQLTYIVGLKCGNILPPVDPNASGTATNLSAFKIKSVIPVKFRCYLDNAMTQLMTAPPTGSVARLSFSKYDSTTDTNDTIEFISAGAANTDNIFRWTGSPDYQFIYNLATAGKTAGTYNVQMTVYAANGTTVLGATAKQYFVLKS